MVIYKSKTPSYSTLKQFLVLFLFCSGSCLGQHYSKFIATLDAGAQTLHVKQELRLHNQSDVIWNEVMLLDWANAFSSTSTPLADRFAEDFKNKFEFASDENRGRTRLSTSTINNKAFTIERLPAQQDIVKLYLSNPLLPNEKQTLYLEYTIDIPEDDYTGYGRSSLNDYNIKYWNLQPAVFINGTWEYYSHKNLHDYYAAPMDISLSLHLPPNYQVASNLKTTIAGTTSSRNSYLLEGKLVNEIRLHMTTNIAAFKKYSTPAVNVLTDIDDVDIMMEMKLVFADRIATFLEDKLGGYPQETMLISERYYRENPIYGLSALPGFLNPFPAGFTHELKWLKSMSRDWIEAKNKVNPRKESWLNEGTLVYLMMQYQDLYYPNLKISGRLSKVWGVRGFNASQLTFNEQYGVLYLNSARQNLDQAINTPADSLIKYNQQLGTPYKTAVGLNYLNDYLGDDALEKSIRAFYNDPVQLKKKAIDLEQVLSKYTTKDVSWFFNDYIASHKFMDWKIKRVRKTADSLTVTIKNKSDRRLPVAVYLLKNDSIVDKIWVNGVESEKEITLSRKRADQVILNYENAPVEFTMRDNVKTLKSFPSLNRPLEFRLFKDIEDPKRSQIYLIPDFTFNVYDGVAIGSRFYNGNLVKQPLKYSIKPAYGTNSNRLVGSVSLSYDHPIQDRSQRLSEVRYGASISTFSYAPELLFRRGSVFLNLGYRPEDLRSNVVQNLTIRNVFVSRDRDFLNPVDSPDFNVFNMNYSYSDNNLKRFISYGTGIEVAQDFTKLDFRTQWRRLFKDNRQLSVRFFAGLFLNNNTQGDGDFFSFALDRPTDYLFDFNYYGRSEDSGLFSQQFIPAEGGFKSQLEPAFANQWIATTNASYSIWKYVFVYGDLGFVKNKSQRPEFVYDSGIRLNLLQDFFELYFPVYSANGWEIAQPNYEEKIRFIVTLDINTAIKLFRRRWY